MNTELEKKAIERLKSFEPDDGYYLCYSGGKDSDVIKILAILANVKHECVHNLTTVDAPETMQYIKSQSDVRVEKSKLSMWRLIEKKGMPPTRLVRYCCSELKEKGGEGKLKITGVRWAESNSRKESSDVLKVIGKPKTNQKLANVNDVEYRVTKQGGLVMNMDNDNARRFIEQCYRTSTAILNPIIDWSDSDVWRFLKHYGCQSNPLYHTQGCPRIGCIGCPMGGYKQMRKDFSIYPIYRQNYVKAFDRMIAKRKALGKNVNEAWEDGEAVMRWWLNDTTDENQITFEDLAEIES